MKTTAWQTCWPHQRAPAWIGFTRRCAWLEAGAEYVFDFRGRNVGTSQYIGANFYFTRPNQSLVLRTGQGQELLRLNKEDGVTYEITLENCDTPQAPPGTHFSYYYDAFDLKPGEPKILIEKCGLPAFGGMSSPCEIVWLSKSNSLR